MGRARCHFDRREKSFSDPWHSLGMTDLGPSLCILGVKRASRAGCQELINGLVKFLWLLRHRKVTGMT